MPRTRTSILINRSVETVFAYVANPENLPEWAARTYDVTMTSVGPVAVGATFMAVGRFLGQRIESPQKVTDYESARRFALRSSSGPITFTFHYAFDRIGDTTQITFEAEVQAGLFFKVAEPIFASAVARLCETDLHRLKTRLEAVPNGRH